jgi:CPA2 family monovalent cation:H+ antiporter-2
MPAGAWAVGKTLAMLNLRAATGATILAISRDGQTVSMPSGHDPLVAGDTLALAGAEHAVEAAKLLLTRTRAPGEGEDEAGV